MINNKDKEIIKKLRQNSRIKLTDMSRQTGIPVSTIHERMQQNTAIKKYSAVIDFEQLGYPNKVFIFFKSNKTKREELKDLLIKNPHTNSLYKINNGYDFLAECLFTGLKDIEDFLELIRDGYSAKADAHYIIEDLVEQAFMTNPLI